VSILRAVGLESMENYTGIKVPIGNSVHRESEAFLLIVLEGESQKRFTKTLKS
jgi:hypothetical protein